MSYIDKNLLPNETVFARAKPHWFIYAPGTIITLFSFMMFSAPEGAEGGSIFLMIGLILLLNAWLLSISTELGVTNKRVIAKTGLISRNTIEPNLSKVESLNVDQSLLGRIFNYGKITVNGTGGIKTPFKMIGSPLDFRRAVNIQIEADTTKTTALAA